MNLSMTILLFISVILVIYMIKYINKHKKNSNKILLILFTLLFSCMFIWDCGLLLQALGAKVLSISPIYFDYISYIGVVFLPVFLYFTSRAFVNPNFKLKKYHMALFIVPVISLIVLWTNGLHKYFYISYSIIMSETVVGAYFYIHTMYTYSLIIISLVSLLKHSISSNRIFSIQTFLFLMAIAIPVLVNIIGMLNIYSISIYMTPISFTFSLLLLFLAIYKFDFLNITPIALNLIIGSLSDSYLILNNNNIIIDCNNSFLETFNINKKDIIDKPIFSLGKDKNEIDSLKITLELLLTNNKKITLQKHYEKIDKYFSIDISPILKNKRNVGTLIFLKDITQLEHDKIQIKNNQNMLIERERLASLGQMVGGIAHNLKTPIFSLSGGLEGLSDLVKEYDESIEDPQVTNQDMHEIANDMKTWITKLKGHVSYMSDVITAVKGQAVNLSEEQSIDFSVTELFQHIKILMQHEIKHSLSILDITNNVPENIQINGSINNLVQVINNLISNAIEGYEKTTNEKLIKLSANFEEHSKLIIISVQDFGPGLPDVVQEKLFKEMITTKGKNGTGLGLFMSYSNIKAHFKGDITFETAKGKGTTFFIKIPV